jgi:ubiquinone/menaquinone biosynthesis C-methylase UbiE
MSQDVADEVRDFWNRVADDWQIQVGDEGDKNRRLNSDPVLWHFAGDVRGLDVLDAGCGTGYLSRKLVQRGARVVAVDLSERMVEIARSSSQGIDFRVDSVSTLATLDDQQFDLVMANYVLMDVPDLPGTVHSFARVLRDRGVAVVMFSHPCFPQGRRSEGPGQASSYSWERPYFEPHRAVDPPWGHFTSDFIWFHRPLSDYWKAFTEAGFSVQRFEEPRLTPDRFHLAASQREMERCAARPYSVAFRLVKGTLL